MSADKHKNLAIRAGYLRAASSESGLGLNIKWARKLTPFLMAMIKDGEIVLRRTNGRGKNVTTAHVTPRGTARLEEILQRFGSDFGPISSIDRVEPISAPKSVRRHKLRSPENLRTEAQKRAAYRRAAIAANAAIRSRRANRQDKNDA
jgi:hypothetical protein